MKLSTPYTYKLRLKKNRTYEVEGADGAKRFTAPVSSASVPKLYTVSSEGKLEYVGITQQPMSTRLRDGLSASGRGGYYGYKWKSAPAEVTLNVWILDGAKAEVADRELETIEAEVVFLCRQVTGQWPISQNEIHFHSSDSFHRESAEEIFTHVQKPVSG